jgi:ubiquinone/menaquinone biosynthesis C-methylase UbiE
LSGWKKKRTIMRRYDATAHIYDMRYADEQMAKINAALRHVEIDAESVLLDAGCGTGLLLDRLSDKDFQIVGIDVSKKSLFEAKKRKGQSGKVFLVQSDADELPFTKVFTHVFAMTLLQNMPKPIETLRELTRVAKDDAVFVVTGLKKIFTKEEFAKSLLKSGLETMFLEDEDDLKCYVAIASIHRH